MRTSKDVGFKTSRISPDHYFRWRIKRCVNPVEKINNIRKLKNSTVLDIGCGFGALSYTLHSYGANVYATEVDIKKINRAKFFLKGKDISLIRVVDEKLPFNNLFFDVIFIFDVIEHVYDPDKLLREIYRTLKPGGYAYVEFTPYYSVVGHHLYDYSKWPIHIFPRRMIKRYILSQGNKGFLTAHDLWNQYLSLNKLKISNFQKMISSFQTINERFIVKIPEVFELNVPFLKYVPMKDFITMSYEGIFRKPV